MKKSEKNKPLGSRQLFHMKKTSLEGKVNDYYQNTHDASNVIEYLVAILVRNALIYEDFVGICQSLVEEIFLTAEPTETLRRYSPLFKPYFKKSGDWDRVINRLFANTKEYYRLTEKMRVNAKYLYAESKPQADSAAPSFNLVSIFKDSSGRKHTWILKDANPDRTDEEVQGLLKLLTTLTIFTGKKARKFAEFMTFDYFENVRHFEEPQEEKQEISNKKFDEAGKEIVEIMLPHGVDPRNLSENEIVVLVKAYLPEGKTFNDIHVLFTELPADPAEDKKEQSESLLAASEPILKEAPIANAQTAIADPPKNESVKKSTKNIGHFSGSQLLAMDLINQRKEKMAQTTGSATNSTKKKKKGTSGGRRRKKKGNNKK